MIVTQLVNTFDAVALVVDGLEHRLRCPGCRSPRRRWRGGWHGCNDSLLQCCVCGQIYAAKRRSSRA